tara:strand:- start:496 stop:777 length:282 start_codon:yes stop_codon:yes gene_type:complete
MKIHKNWFDLFVQFQKSGEYNMSPYPYGDTDKIYDFCKKYKIGKLGCGKDKCSHNWCNNITRSEFLNLFTAIAHNYEKLEKKSKKEDEWLVIH